MSFAIGQIDTPDIGWIVLVYCCVVGAFLFRGLRGRSAKPAVSSGAMQSLLVKRPSNTTETEQPGSFRSDSIRTDPHHSEIQAIKEALSSIEDETDELRSNGLSQVSFTAGIVCLVFDTAIFCHWPEHFWIAYMVQNALFIPLWWFQMVKVYKGQWFIVDYCWIVNIIYTLMMLCLLAGAVPAEWIVPCYTAFLASALGPLGWACVVLHNGLVFHSVEKMTSLFIHFMPCLTVLAIRESTDQIQQTWPGRFPTQDQLDGIACVDIYRVGLQMYVVWLVLHGIWLLTVGLSLPDKGYDTVFHDLYIKNNLAQVFKGLTNGRADTLQSHAVVYLIIHCIAVMVSFLWALLAHRYLEVHYASALVLFLAAAWCGAGYYDYLIAKKYLKVLSKLLHDKEDATLQATKKS